MSKTYKQIKHKIAPNEGTEMALPSKLVTSNRLQLIV
ncbi:hypothetical protein VCG_001337 [Vibrio cholerae 12129(1)]|nr:hypothetical protein VCG_001337 [Vibrio cholerae 12129(1)]